MRTCTCWLIRIAPVQRGSATVILAVFSIYALDFAINAGEDLAWNGSGWRGVANEEIAVQWSCRSLIIDTLPVSKQQSGSAWGELPRTYHVLIITHGEC